MRNRSRLRRDYYVRLDTNHYSVDPRLVGPIVDVLHGPAPRRVRELARLVSEHVRPGSGCHPHRSRAQPHGATLAVTVSTTARHSCR
ncbi:Mu transposase domain-containing protein [Leekyejoonella antrihumi]|uniref:Mu transposase domain-containing protein n=1 Tax=Leekyejoonella antrihumi TaxID=1660198 RepID=UPI003CCC83AC